MVFNEILVETLAGSLTSTTVAASMRGLRRLFADPPRAQALERCTEAGILAMLRTVEVDDEVEHHPVEDLLTKVFTGDEYGADAGKAVAPLLRGERLDREGLRELFEEAGFEPAKLPGLDLGRALEAFEGGFVAAATEQKELQGEIRTQLLFSQLDLQREILEELRRLGAHLASAERGTTAVSAEGIVAHTVAGVQIFLDRSKEVGAPTSDGSGGRDPLRESYLRRVMELSGSLTLGGVDPVAASEKQDQALQLEAVYTALLTTSADEREPKAIQRGRPAQPIAALEQLRRHRRLVLLGDPGSGKSTFVNFVALCLAGERVGSDRANLELLTQPLPQDDGTDEEARQRWDLPVLLPVRIVLRDLAAGGLPEVGEKATASHLWQFLEGELEKARLGGFASTLEETLRSEGGLVLFDGLDEVPEAEGRREQILQAVGDFVASFGKCRYLVTCRTYAYQEQRWRLPGFEVAVLAPLSAGQVRRFVDRWYAQVAELERLSGESAQGRAERLKAAIFGSDRLQALAERPLLLTLMASLHAWRGGTLPEKREELYASAVDLLLHHWEQRRVIEDASGKAVVLQPSLAEWLKVDRDEVRSLLDHLAYEAHASQADPQGAADVAQEALISGLMKVAKSPDARPGRLEEFLRDRAGLLVGRGVGVYTFPHRTFQEYLAACYLTDCEYPDRLAELARGDSERWREVVLLAGAKAGRGSSASVWLLAEALCFRDPSGEVGSEDSRGAHLAGLLLAELAALERVSGRHRKTLNRVIRWQVKLLEGEALPARERVECGRSAAVLGDVRDPVTTLDRMEFCWVPGGPFWMGDDEGYDDEKPQHRNEHLSYGYWLARYPVTVAQLRDYVKRSGREPEDRDAFLGPGSSPVVEVSWEEAMSFCSWLTADWREKGFLPEGLGVRLPSEAEWEKGARGGLEIPREPWVLRIGEVRAGDVGERCALKKNAASKRSFPWGDDFDKERCNSHESGIGGVSAVGCFRGGRSPYGCEELSGNVWEWTRSRWGEAVAKPDFCYPYDPSDGREATDREIAKTLWILRGGAYFNVDDGVRCSARDRGNPRNRNNFVGFRVALSPI